MRVSVEDHPLEVLDLVLEESHVGPGKLPHFVDLLEDFIGESSLIRGHKVGLRLWEGGLELLWCQDYLLLRLWSFHPSSRFIR